MINFSISTIQFMEIENTTHAHTYAGLTYRLSIYYAN